MKKMSRILLVLGASISLFSVTLSANTLPNQTTNIQNENSNISQIFVNFIDTAFLDTQEVHISNHFGMDVSHSYINTFTTYHRIKDYRSIQKLIMDNDLCISYTTKQVTPSIRSLSRAATRREHFNEYFYHLESDSKNHFPKKEWVTKLSGSVTVQPNTGKIVSASSPTLSLDTANFGGAFSPSLANISTDSKISGDSVRFHASYKMTATLGVELGGLPIGFNLDYGRHTDSFTANPEF